MCKFFFSPKYLPKPLCFIYSKWSHQQVVGEGTGRGSASVGVLANRNQVRQFGIHPNLLCFMLVCCALFFFTPASAQKKHTSKIKTTKASHNRVIYGLASFYHDKFNNRRTSSGEIFSQTKLTCACNMLPLGTWIKVTNMRNDKSVIVKVNDRLHPKMRIMADLTSAAAKKLGNKPTGLIKIEIEVIGKKKSR